MRGIVVFILLFPGSVCTQPVDASTLASRKVDSLSSIIASETQDSVRIRALLILAQEIHRTDPDSAMHICELALEQCEDALASNSSDKRLLSMKGDALKKLGYTYQRVGELDKALEYLELALPIAKQVGDQRLYIMCVINIGITHDYKGNYDVAIKNYKRALEMSQAIKDTGLIGASYGNLAVMYEFTGQPLKALDYQQLSMELAKQIGDMDGVAAALHSKGGIYHDLGDVSTALMYFLKALKISEEIQDWESNAVYLNSTGMVYHLQGDTAEAIKCYTKALEINRSIGYTRGIAAGYNNMAFVYQDAGNHTKELEYSLKALELYEQIGDKNRSADALYNLGTFYTLDTDSLSIALGFFRRVLKIREELGDISGMTLALNGIAHCHFWHGKVDSAAYFATRSRNIAEELGFPHEISQASKTQSIILKSKGDYEEALEAYEVHIKMRDSLKNEDTQKATIRQQTKYEFEKAQLIQEQQEKEEARLAAQVTSRRDNLQYSVIFIAILVLFGGVLALGFVKVSLRMAEGIIFFSFLIFFEFVLVLADPYIENWSSGAPGIKLLFNAGIAALIFPLHHLFETRLKKRLITS